MRAFARPTSANRIACMQRLAMVGFGDIARRAAPALERKFVLVPLSRRYGFDLDQPPSLTLSRAEALVHCAPPPAFGECDPRTGNLLAALDRAREVPRRIVYLSTSGVYGDCAGAWVTEDRPIAPQTPRARRRADAEAQLRGWCDARRCALVILRVPGIYAGDRLPLERLRARLPVLRAEDDVYTNHIHADDLAAVIERALSEDAPAGVYNACDDTQMHMGDWLDLVADCAGLARAPRLPRGEIERALAPTRASFMRESRRLNNRRLKTVLRVRLRYPTVQQGLEHEHATGAY
jgi:nucleoside-diphosphate-sugar epimerase